MSSLNLVLGVLAAGVVGGTLYLAATATPPGSSGSTPPGGRVPLGGGDITKAAPKVIGPPPGATMAPSDPSAVIGSILGVRNPTERDVIAANWNNQWVPNEGWEGEVVDVKRELMEGGYSIRLEFKTGNMLRDFFVVCHVPDNEQDVRKGDRAKVQGRIEKVEVLPGAAGTPINRILLKSGRVVELIKMAPR
jgi:hypothetical protein